MICKDNNNRSAQSTFTSGNMITTHGGGTSRKRMHACKDYSGAEIMRTLRDEVLNRLSAKITILLKPLLTSVYR